MDFLVWLKNFFTGHDKVPSRSLAELQGDFRQQYQNFRSLLTANNTALEIMAEMEQALSQGRPFSMAFIRGHSAALAANVLKMADLLQALSGGRYQGLPESCQSISSTIAAILALQAKDTSGEFVVPLSGIDRSAADQVGEKMANLGEVAHRAGCKIPDGFVITAAGTSHFIQANNLRDEIRRRLTGLDHENLAELFVTSAAIQSLITSAPLPADLEEKIQAQYRRLTENAGRPVTLALRSSATGEDSGNTSFAGQYRTQLHVDGDSLGRTFKEIVAGKYRSQAIVYRMQRGFRHQDVTMCVGCLVMVDAVVSGVAYSRSPDDPGGKMVVISAAPGYGDKVVEGRGPAALFLVERQEPHQILKKELPGSSPAGLPQEEEYAALGDEKVRQLARIAVSLEEHFGAAQDIEWSIDSSGEIFILQSRPLQQQPRSEAADALPGFAEPGEEEPVLSGGIVVSQGIAAGPVHIVRNNDDLLGFPRGGVLVVEHPLPEYAALLGRAVAVLSESGQLTTHLATVAREFRIPGIFAVPGASAALANGGMITVDARRCLVYAGRREELLAQAEPLANLMVGSPVYNILEQVLQHVRPLNLTDPASSSFQPLSCKTYHDVIRFCHEKAMTEIFSFGTGHGLAERAARQLTGEGPYSWWVINLDDGLRQGAAEGGKEIALADIISLPMLAIWEGMAAIPWQGPPPLSIRGFGAVIMQSMMNRNLDPGVRSVMTDRNYFLIAKNFCQATVRLGYHFSVIEAFVSERINENYVSFQCRGGAADDTRRIGRADLLNEILHHFGFQTGQKGDFLIARCEKKPLSYLQGRLKILGYLLMHARLIDMAMDKEQMVAGYRKKMMGDIETILASHDASQAMEPGAPGAGVS